MRKLTVAAVAAVALALAGTAGAALVLNPFNGVPNCQTTTFSNGVLHLAKTCPTTANAEAGADITGFEGQQFVSGSFTLASTSQCYGGAPRFTILMTSGKIFFVSCNLVTPRINPDGTATYVFNASTLPAEFVPVGTIKQVDIALDVQGASDITRIFFNGVRQLPAGTGPLSKAECKNGGWKTFADPKFKNQGQCIAFFNHHNGRGKDDTKTSGGHPKSGHGH